MGRFDKLLPQAKPKQQPWMSRKTKHEYDKLMLLTLPTKGKDKSEIDPEQTLARHEILWDKVTGGLSLEVVMENEAMQQAFPLDRQVVEGEADTLEELAGWVAHLVYGKQFTRYLLNIRRQTEKLKPGSKLVIPAMGKPEIEAI